MYRVILPISTIQDLTEYFWRIKIKFFFSDTGNYLRLQKWGCFIGLHKNIL